MIDLPWKSSLGHRLFHPVNGKFCLKILFIESAYGFGGALTGLLEVIRYLPDRMTPVLVTPFDPWSYVEQPDRLDHERVDIDAPLPKTDGHWLPGIFRYYRQYYRPWYGVTQRMIDRHQPSLVFANNSLSINFGVGRAAASRKVKSICHQKDFEYPGRFMRAMASRSPFSHHIASSRPIEDHLVQLGVQRDRCTEIFDLITPPADGQFERRCQRVPQDPPIVSMHSMVIHWKGQHVFLRAVAELARRGETNFRPVIAGSPPAGEPDYLNELKALAAELKIADRIEWAGHQKDVYEYLANVDIAVHASVTPEPFGRVVPEVMLMGIPGVISTGGGPEQYVADGVMGLHAAGGDVNALADAIEKLLAMSPRQREVMGEAARQHALLEFAPERLAGQMVSLFDRVVAG